MCEDFIFLDMILKMQTMMEELPFILQLPKVIYKLSSILYSQESKILIHKIDTKTHHWMMQKRENLLILLYYYSQMEVYLNLKKLIYQLHKK